MTFLERVQAVEAARGDVRAVSTRLSIDDLRREVGRRMPFEQVASVMAENPERARNELRAVCREVLSERAHGLPAHEQQRMIDEFVDVVFGMGPIEELVEDEAVTEIMVNGARSIYYERNGKLERSDLSFESDEQVRVLIDRIIGPLGRRIDESSPMVDARLPQGHRVNAVIPPLALDGPHVTIRSFSRRVMTLDEMVERGSFGEDVKALFELLVKLRKNVVVSGGTGSGKTTLLNALSCLIGHDERVITIEDSAELKFSDHPHVVRLEARPRNAEGEGEVTIRSLVINALRMRPDRIIVGECRGGEALDMLQSMNTGHDGSLTTLHANSPQDVVDRMTTMVRYAVDLPVDAIEAQIGNAFDAIVQVSRAPGGMRIVSGIAEVFFERVTRRCSVECLYERDPFGSCDWWVKTPSCIEEAMQRGLMTREEADRWRQRCSGA